MVPCTQDTSSAGSATVPCTSMRAERGRIPLSGNALQVPCTRTGIPVKILGARFGGAKRDNLSGLTLFHHPGSIWEVCRNAYPGSWRGFGRLMRENPVLSVSKITKSES